VLDGHEQNPEIEQERPALDVVEVVLDSLAKRGPPTPSVDLGPARHSARDSMAEVVVGDIGAEPLDEDRPLGSWANQAHLALEDVEELGQLVDIRPAQPGADPGTAVVGGRGPDRPGCPLGVALHASELEHLEEPPPLPDPLLHVEDRPARGDQDDRRDDQEEGRKQEKTSEGGQEVDASLRHAVPAPGSRGADRGDVRRGVGQDVAAGVGRDPVDANVRVGDDLDLAPYPVRGAIRKRHDKVGRLEAIDPLFEPVDPTDDGNGLGLGMNGELPASGERSRDTRMSSVDEADNGQIGPGAKPEGPGKASAVAASAHDQDTAIGNTAGRAVPELDERRGHGGGPPFHRCLPSGVFRATAGARLDSLCVCERSDHPWSPLPVSLKLFHRPIRPSIPVIPERNARLGQSEPAEVDRVPKSGHSGPVQSTSTGRRRLAVVIVNYNSWPDIERLVTDLSVAAEVRDGRAEILVVDNASPDPMPLSLRTLPMGVTLIARGENGGFAVGVNAGWAAARGCWLLVLNPDVVAGAELIAEVLRRVERFEEVGSDPPGIVGFGLRNLDGSPQPSVGVFPTLFRTIWEQLIPRSRRKYQPDWRIRAGPVSWVTGACVLLNPRMMDDVGGMDEDFFLYYEEVALCHTACDRGWRVEYDPGLTVIHLRPLQNRAISPKMRVITRHSKLLYFRKHLPRWQFLALAAIVWFEAVVRGAWAQARHRSADARTWQTIRGIARRLRDSNDLRGRAVIELAEAAVGQESG
jgi:N-acetylglucosaminyl-diphospho-decaprenol L-rhamnosyltransferase